MAMNPERELKKRKRLTRSFAWIMGLSLYAGLWIGGAWLRHGMEFYAVFENAVSDFLSMLPADIRIFRLHITKWPGCIYLLPAHVGWVAASLLTGAFFCLSEYVTYVLNKNTRPGEEHGSAQFNMDYKKLVHDYVMSPRILMQLKKKELDKAASRYGRRSRRYMRLEKKAKQECCTVKASGGRQLCKRSRFTKQEIAWCLLHTQLYSKNVALSLDTRLTQLNLNVVVFGGSGAGKSRFFVEDNLLQANSSFVVTDPSGELMMKVGKFLESQGYVIKCLNIERMEESQRYNPFAYVYEDSDIPVMVDALISNIEGPKKGGSGDNKFWDETSRTLLIAICGYLFETQPMERRNFNNVIKLIDLMDVSDERSQPEDELDKLFNDLELANPSSYAVSNYKVIKSAGTGKTAQNIVISTLAIFARFFKLDKIANLTYRDELHLEEIGRRKSALFIVTPQGDTTYNFLASELYTQLFQILYRQGEQNARDRHSTSVSVDVPVRCLIDEAANVGVIPHLPEKVSTMRKYGISIALIYQNQAQVKALMKDDWETLVGNCDTMLFLGGIDASTVKTVSERLGKGTINTKNNSINKGNKGGGSTSIQATGRELMTTTEIEQMRNDHCIVFIRSMKPFNDFKYPLEQHPNYKYTGDADEKNFFVAPWHLTLDRVLMASLNVKRVGEEGYINPERAKWTTDAEVAVIKKDQALRRAAAMKAMHGAATTGGSRASNPGNGTESGANVNTGGTGGSGAGASGSGGSAGGMMILLQNMESTHPNDGVSIDRFINASAKSQVFSPLSEEERNRLSKVISERKINLGLDEELKIYQMTMQEAEQFLTLKEGYAPDLEFESGGYAFELELPETEQAENEQVAGHLFSNDNLNTNEEGSQEEDFLIS